MLWIIPRFQLSGRHEHTTKYRLLNLMSKRERLRQRYMQAWYDLNAEELLATTSNKFIFDDPAEPEPVTRAMLEDYMHRWDKRPRVLGSDNRWNLTHELRQDRDGILTDWEWWEIIGTELCGAAIVQTSDEEVLSERITYFDRKIRHPRAG